MSQFPSNKAISNSFKKSDLPPISYKGLSKILSPEVVIFMSSISIVSSIFFICCPTICACHNANGLFLVAILIFFGVKLSSISST